MRGDTEKSIPWDRHKKAFHLIKSMGQIGKLYPFNAFNMSDFLGC